ncbi:MAG: AAA family ATPase [Acidimicrobiales bacterium]|nr:AAA family ATPase [Acidimicrobiales bacterium]MCB9395117.1 AAA family ATPase [Acidimicrobiaceae bacterium]
MLTGRIGLSPAMIGRSGALHRLRALIDQADDQSSDLPAVALVVGEAGIGKTRLVREALDELAPEVLVLAGAAEPGSLSRSFDLVAQLAPAGSSQPAADALTRITDAASPADGDPRTVVVVADDLHWIDAESAAFLDDLARRPLPSVMIVGTYRPSDLRRGSPGGDLVSRFERRNEVEQLRLERLDRHEVGAMMTAISSVTSAAPISSAAVEAVTRRSGGVPFVVEELMRCIDADACGGEVFDVQLPWSLEEAVRHQLADLSQVERTVVDALAVLAEPSGFEVLASATGLTDDDLLSGLRRLMEREVVVELRDDRLWFHHALMADAVQHQLLGRERRRLHERCFDTLARLVPDDHAGLVRHAIGAGRYDEIVPIARRGARDYLDRGASFQALRLACEGLAEEPAEVELRAVATEAAWRLDFADEALDHARRWRELAPGERDRIDAQRYVGRLLHELGDETGTQASIDELALAAARFEHEGALAEQARAEAAVAQLLMLRHDAAAIEWAERAIEHAHDAGDRAVEVQAKVERASTLLMRATRDEALAALQEAVAGAAAIGDGVLRARAINNMMELLPPAAPETAALRRELHDGAAAVGLDKLGGANISWLDAIAAQAEGDMAEFRRLLDLWSSGLRPSFAHAIARPEQAYLALEEGRLADAAAQIAEIDDDTDDGHRTHPLTLRLLLAGLRRDTATAREIWARLAIHGTPVPDGWSVASTVVDDVAAALAAGLSPDEVRAGFDGPVLAAQPAVERIRPAVDGLLHLAEQRPAEAVVALRRALDTAPRDVTRPVQGLLETALAQALLHAGDRAGARRAIDAALESLARWPGWRRDRAEALAARLEGSALRSTDALTARESEVAALIAEGLTNGQLAERLFISPKTASVHVSNILAKLGLSTRAEIAAWEIRRRLPTGS